MQFVPYRMLRAGPSALRKKLESEGELVVTVDGKPFAVMIDLSETESMEDILLMISRLRAQMAARSIRSSARRNGLDTMSVEQIDEIVSKTREERKA